MGEDWQSSLAKIATTVTAAMLIAAGGTMVSVTHQQARITVQIEGLVDNLDALTRNVRELELRVRSLETEGRR